MWNVVIAYPLTFLFFYIFQEILVKDYSVSCSFFYSIQDRVVSGVIAHCSWNSVWVPNGPLPTLKERFSSHYNNVDKCPFLWMDAISIGYCGSWNCTSSSLAVMSKLKDDAIC